MYVSILTDSKCFCIYSYRWKWEFNLWSANMWIESFSPNYTFEQSRPLGGGRNASHQWCLWLMVNRLNINRQEDSELFHAAI